MTQPGTDLRRLGELHVQQARSAALRIQAFSTGVFPGEWMSRIVEDATIALVEFAFHSRRVNNICGFDHHRFEPITTTAYKVTSNDPGNWEVKYQDALNSLAHAKGFVFGSTHIEHRQLSLAAEANLAPLYVKVAADHRPRERTISLFGVSFCFLQQVIPLVKVRCSDWQF